MKIIEGYLPIFTGFYHTTFSSDDAETMVLEENDLNWEDVTWNYKEYMDRVAQACISSVWNYLKHDGIEMHIKFDSVYSPREYNYGNDSINCTYIVKDKDYNNLIEYCKEHLNEFNEYLAEKFTSRPGFSSYFEPDSEKWFNDYLDPNYVDDGFANFPTAFGSLLEFYLTNQGYDVDEMTDDVQGEMYIDYEENGELV